MSEPENAQQIALDQARGELTGLRTLFSREKMCIDRLSQSLAEALGIPEEDRTMCASMLLGVCVSLAKDLKDRTNYRDAYEIAHKQLLQSREANAAQLKHLQGTAAENAALKKRVAELESYDSPPLRKRRCRVERRT